MLILDGWDEISLSASAGYLQQIERMLRDVRETFLERRNVPVRVILTGRPTDAVEKSKFLRDSTVLLTMQPFDPDQLATYIARIRDATSKLPDDGATIWRGLHDEKLLADITARYREEYQREQTGQAARPAATGERFSRLDILGSPLLAYLALRLPMPGTGGERACTFGIAIRPSRRANAMHPSSCRPWCSMSSKIC